MLDDRELRKLALEQATYSAVGGATAQEIVRAAELFYQFLTGTSEKPPIFPTPTFS